MRFYTNRLTIQPWAGRIYICVWVENAMYRLKCESLHGDPDRIVELMDLFLITFLQQANKCNAI